MTFKIALDKLKKDRILYTSMLEPLGIPFEHFLIYGQMNKERSDNAITKLILKLERQTTNIK